MSRSGTVVLCLLVVAVLVEPPLEAGWADLESPPARWAIIVDGDPGDWEGVPVTYLDESVRVFALSHDDTNLYLMWRFADEFLARRILRLGVTLWLDGDGKKRKDLGVRYAGSESLFESTRPSPADEGRGGDRPPQNGDFSPRDQGGGFSGRGQRGDNPMREWMQSRIRPGAVVLIEGDQVHQVSEDSFDLPRAASAVHDGVYCYELQVPLACIGGDAASLPADTRRKLRIGVEIGGLSRAEREQLEEMTKDAGGGRGGIKAGLGGGMGRGGGMGGGMGRGGGMGGGMGRGGGPPRPPASKPEWLKISLLPTKAEPTPS